MCAHYTPDELGVHCEGGRAFGGSIIGGGGRAPAELPNGGGLGKYTKIYEQKYKSIY